MNDLRSQKCIPCEVGGQPLSEETMKTLLEQVPGWELIEEDEMQKVKKEFKFTNFKEALYFVDRVSAVAEEEDHHPKIVLEWGKVNVYWWTHKVKGLHQNDFIMADKTDEVYEESQS